MKETSLGEPGSRPTWSLQHQMMAEVYDYWNRLESQASRLLYKTKRVYCKYKLLTDS